MSGWGRMTPGRWFSRFCTCVNPNSDSCKSDSSGKVTLAKETTQWHVADWLAQSQPFQTHIHRILVEATASLKFFENVWKFHRTCLQHAFVSSTQQYRNQKQLHFDGYDYAISGSDYSFLRQPSSFSISLFVIRLLSLLNLISHTWAATFLIHERCSMERKGSEYSLHNFSEANLPRSSEN